MQISDVVAFGTCLFIAAGITHYFLRKKKKYNIEISEGKDLGEDCKLLFGIRSDKIKDSNILLNFMTDMAVIASVEQSNKNPDLVTSWLTNGEAKITCKVRSLEEMQGIIEDCKKMGIHYLTKELEGEPVVIAIGPDKAVDIDMITKSDSRKLPLLS